MRIDAFLFRAIAMLLPDLKKDGKELVIGLEIPVTAAFAKAYLNGLIDYTIFFSDKVQASEWALSIFFAVSNFGCDRCISSESSGGHVG